VKKPFEIFIELVRLVKLCVDEHLQQLHDWPLQRFSAIQKMPLTSAIFRQGHGTICLISRDHSFPGMHNFELSILCCGICHCLQNFHIFENLIISFIWTWLQTSEVEDRLLKLAAMLKAYIALPVAYVDVECSFWSMDRSCLRCTRVCQLTVCSIIRQPEWFQVTSLK